MADLRTAIPVVRESVAAILRIHITRPKKITKGKPRSAQVHVFFGSAFCVLADRYLVTAFHILNEGQQRNPDDRFYALTVPGNGDQAFHFPVVGYPIEHPDSDLAVLEIGPCATAGIHIPALPVSFAPQQDGTRVVTAGFPSPEIASINVDAEGNYCGGQFFLKSHANEGIISAQYVIDGAHIYELNVDWYHGESGGPVVSIEDEPRAFSLMQHYRHVRSPYRLIEGPHRGVALSSIQQELTGLGVAAV
jgi:hypothetical protein